MIYSSTVKKGEFMMTASLESILKDCEKEIEKMGATNHPRRRRYSGDLKKNVRSFVALGGKKTILSSRLGLAITTIRKWDEKTTDQEKSFKKIQVVPNNACKKNIVLNTPSGCTVQFENLQDLASVLKMIS